MTARVGEAGFTLVEMLLVVAIMAATAAVAAPLLRGPPVAAQLKADTKRFAAALRITRAAAMAQNRDLAVTLDRDNHAFASSTVPASRLDPRIEISADGTTSSGRSQILFFPSGRSSGGTVRFRVAQLESRIRVIWATGDVLVDE